MCKVSIIVVAYNLENHIEKCLNSIVNQTLKDIEIIVVNDGSTDDTINRIYSISKSDKRFKVINKKNEGVSKARKSGYNNAIGEYIYFIDGDDWISDNAIELLYKKAKEKNYDIVCHNFYYAFNNDILQEVKQEKFSELNGNEFLKKNLLDEVLPSIWSKFLKRDFIENNNIEIPDEFIYGEDLAFSMELAINKPKVTYLNEAIYFYYQRSNSITNSISDKVLQIDKVIMFIKNLLIEENLYNEYKEEFEFMVFNHNFNYRLEAILRNSKSGKELYNTWKRYDISLKNKYIKYLLKNQGHIRGLGIKILNYNFTIGKLYFNVKRLLKK